MFQICCFDRKSPDFDNLQSEQLGDWLEANTSFSDEDIYWMVESGVGVIRANADGEIQHAATCASDGSSLLIHGDPDIDDLRELLVQLATIVEKASFVEGDMQPALENKLAYVGFNRKKQTGEYLLELAKLEPSDE